MDADVIVVGAGMFDTILQSVSVARTALPAAGMGTIPAQLAAGLPEGSVRRGCSVTAVRSALAGHA